jgi:large subunit ribosomal protein L4
MDAPQTSRVAGLLKTLGLTGRRTLLVVDQTDERVWKSCRNLANLRTTLAHQLNAYDLLSTDAVVFTGPGLQKVQEVFVR